MTKITDAVFTVTIEEVQEHIRNNPQHGMKLIVVGDTYLTVEDEEGFRAYMQANRIGRKFFRSYDFSTVHKPNHGSGSGWQYAETMPTLTMEQVIDMLKETLSASKARIVSGREKMDTRKPHESGRYLTN